jgi:hypothetical protein
MSSNVVAVKHPVDMSINELEDYIKARFVELHGRVNRRFNEDGKMTREQVDAENRDAAQAIKEIKQDPYQHTLFNHYCDLERARWKALEPERRQWMGAYMVDQMRNGVPDRVEVIECD